MNTTNHQTLCIVHRALCIVAAFAATAANAATSTWISGSTGGWNDPASWEGGVPGASDTVAVPDGVDLPVRDADAALCGSVAAITLGTGSRIVFDLDSTDCSISGTITGSGQIVKNGAATVYLLSTADNAYKTTGGMRVNAGTLQCPQTFGSNYNSTRFNIGPLHVEEGATFNPYARYRITEVTSLTGDGRIAQVTAGGYWPFRISNTTRSTFPGTIAGTLILNVNGKIDLTSETNSFSGGINLNNNADLGIVKFGNRNDNSSTLGTWYVSGGERKFRDITFLSTGTLRYLGTGETSDKHIKLGGGSGVWANATIDAGATGGLTLSGKIYQSEEAAVQSVLTLAGANAAVSTLSGIWEDCGINSTYLAKRGTGTWFLAHNADRCLTGVVGVEEGTLQFDTLDETNIPCSFGLSTRLAQKYTGTWDETRKADYAILLGSADAEGVLEYVGTKLYDNSASSRPVAVTGRGGRIVSSVAGRRIGIKGAFAANAAGGTLTLDGDGTTNYLYNVSDGHGTMSVAKAGSGTWVLAGDQTFGGKLVVTGGEVVVSSTLGAKYSWYRFTIKRNYGTASGIPGGDPQTRMYEFALYDVEGNRVNLNLSDCATNTIPAVDQACYWGKAFTGTLSHLFDNAAKWASGNPYLWGAKPVPSLDDPSSWIRIVMRLDASKAEAAYYDLCSYNGNTHFWEPNAWTVEASPDGIFWDTVANVTSNSTVYSGAHWISDDSAFAANAKRIPSHPDFVFGLDKGKSLLSGAPSQLTNATVTVADGAVLRAEGDVSVKSIEVDVSKPAGTIDGFAFAPGGTLSVTGSGSLTGTLVLPTEFQNASGAQNLSTWTVNVGGREVGRRLLFSDGHIAVVPLGMRIIVR